MTLPSDKLDRQARRILRDNDRGGYTVPTAGLYPYQWNWDSCFAAWGFATFDLKRAWFEINTLFIGQWDNGMVPHIIFHQRADGYFPGPEVWGTHRVPPTSGITQPPVAATFVRSLYEADKRQGHVHLVLLFDRLLAWHRWFMTHRVDDGMVAITHPWESGRDNAVDWDGAMANVNGSGVGDYKRRDTSHVNPEMRPRKADYDRYLTMLYFGRDCGWDESEIRAAAPFRTADVGMTFILLRATRDLLQLALDLDRETDEIQAWIATLEGGADNHWNPDGFYDSKDLRTGQFSGALSSASCLCWYAGIENAKMRAHLDRLLDEVNYTLPSLAPWDSRFEPLRYWRGPVWGVINSLVAIGLREKGHSFAADRIRKDTRRLIERSGFFEYFSPTDGSPAGGGAFTWTAAVWLAFAGPHAKGKL